MVFYGSVIVFWFFDMKEGRFRSAMGFSVNVHLEAQRWLNWLALRAQAKTTRKFVFCIKRREEFYPLWC